MRKIERFKLTPGHHVNVSLPMGFKVVHAQQMPDDNIYMWVEVEERAPVVGVTLLLVRDREPIIEGEHCVTFVVVSNTNFAAFHIYRKTS